MIPACLALAATGCGRESEPPSQPAEARKLGNGSATVRQGGTAPTEKTSPVILDKLIVFIKPQECEMADQTYDLLASTLKYGDGKGVRPGTLKVPPAYSSAFGKPRFVRDDEGYGVAHVPIAATWHGLRILELQNGMGETDAWFTTFVFGEPFEKVRSTLNRLGFSIDAKGDQQQPPFSEAPRVALHADGHQTELDCWF